LNLDGLIASPSPDFPPLVVLNASEKRDNGFDIHAGMSELSRILYLRPSLVASGYKHAPSYSARTFLELMLIARKDNWPGYFGSPRLATASRGAKIYERQSARMIRTATEILDGKDPMSYKRFADLSLSDPGELKVAKDSKKRDEEIRKRQSEWLRKNKIPIDQ